jgi:hypothetical protein
MSELRAMMASFMATIEASNKTLRMELKEEIRN